MQNARGPAPLTPPSTPPSERALRGGAFHSQVAATPSSPASRLGKYLGKSLQLQAILGTGAYGVVYEAYDHLTGTRYAVKALSKTNANGSPLDRRQQDFQAREIQLHYAASAHPNVLSMYRLVEDVDCTYVILEHCPEGDLFSNITEKGRYVGDEELVRDVFLQILDAVQHCHRLGIYHRDLKPENILVDQGGAKVLLADFGLATMDTVSNDHGCGSTFYMSEECLDQATRNLPYICAPNDVWSLGVILVNLTCGRNPWKAASSEDSTYRAYLRNRDFLKTILPLTDEFNELLGMIFERDPERRISLPKLRQRFLALRHFCIPPPMPMDLPTPPLSPCASKLAHTAMEDVTAAPFDAPSTGASSSDSIAYPSSDSDMSDESDSDFDTGYDSPAEHDITTPVTPTTPASKAFTRPSPRRHAHPPVAPYQPRPQYVLPSPTMVQSTPVWHVPHKVQPYASPSCAAMPIDAYYTGHQATYAQSYAYAYGVYHGFPPGGYHFAGHCY